MNPWKGMLRVDPVLSTEDSIAVSDESGAVFLRCRKAVAEYVIDVLNLPEVAPPIDKRVKAARRSVSLELLSLDCRDASIAARPSGLDLIELTCHRNGATSHVIVATFWPDTGGNYDHASQVMDELRAAREMREAIKRMGPTGDDRAKALSLLAKTAEMVNELGLAPEHAERSIFSAIYLLGTACFGVDHPLTRFAATRFGSSEVRR